MKYLAIALYLLSINSFAYKVGDVVKIGSEDACPACKASKEELKDHNIPFTVIVPTKDSDYIPQLYVNGKYMGCGVPVVENYIND